MPVNDNDALTTAAKAIGTTLGKIAVKTGMVKPPGGTAKVRKKAAVKKKTPTAQVATGAKAKTASKTSLRKRAPKKKPGK